MLNTTNIPAPRVPVLDGTTGLMSRQWYRFFYNLFIRSNAVIWQVPATVSAATYSVNDTDVAVQFQAACVVALPLEATGRVLLLSTLTADAVTSAEANVVPLGSTTPGTAILAATAGKFAMLQNDGTNWITLQAN